MAILRDFGINEKNKGENFGLCVDRIGNSQANCLLFFLIATKSSC